MKPPPFVYHAPETLADAVAALNSHENALVLAGGQSLMPMLNMRYVFPDHLVDLNRVKELSYIKDTGVGVRIGSMTRQRDIEFSEEIVARTPIFREAILQVGHRQTRNRGTVGGSLCNLDSAAELPALCVLYDAVLTARGSSGEREIPASEFCQGFMQNALAAGEILTEIKIEPWAPGHGYAFVEYARRHGDFAIVSAGALIELDGDSSIRRIALVIGGALPVPQRMTAAERLLTRQEATPDAFQAAAQLCGEIDAISDTHVPGWYRKRLAISLSKRALATAWRRASASRA